MFERDYCHMLLPRMAVAYLDESERLPSSSVLPMAGWKVVKGDDSRILTILYGPGTPHLLPEREKLEQSWAPGTGR